ncbi:MAG: hypothetical protein KZQ73_00660 [Candidatus Thiodiazotropha sp. (ex Semelilucina semeliformis)]|nr:hypothetical protein [Candidatus Thiodiazotropha sp. (ex Semelilucina semeliformis)]
MGEVIHTSRGKIQATQGHITPACRTVTFLENGDQNIQRYRIADTAGDDDINSVILAAMMADRDVIVSYDPNVTSGCGTEPKIVFITAF